MDNLRFEQFIMSDDKPDKLTKRFYVYSTHSEQKLAIISWYGAWRQYVLQDYIDIIWSWDCLKEASEFLKNLNEEHKLKKKSPVERIENKTRSPDGCGKYFSELVNGIKVNHICSKGWLCKDCEGKWK